MSRTTSRLRASVTRSASATATRRCSSRSTHGNNAEFVPLALIVMLLLEMCGADRVALHIYGGLLLAARIAHWIGLPRKAPNVFRYSGVAATWVLIIAGAIYLLVLRFQITGAI
ncbi:MAG: MAPEG family protein [Kofleriaceae bacterium]